MAVTTTWDAAYEALPADTNDISQGALRIRNLKRDISERGEVDHHWKTSGSEGYHRKCTLKDLASDPSAVAGTGIAYAKTSSGRVEFFYRDNLGSITQLTQAGDSPAMPSGTKMYFFQASAPVGWTRVTGVGDRIVRLTDGADGGQLHGTNWVVSGLSHAHTHSVVMPEHRHPGTTAITGGGSPAIGGIQGTPIQSIAFIGVAPNLSFNVSEVCNVYLTGGATPGLATTSGGASTATVSSNGAWRPPSAMSIVAQKD